MAATSWAVIGLAMSMPSTSPAKQGPTCRIVIAIAGLLLTQRRELRRNCERRLLAQHDDAGIARRRPDALGDGVGADALALAHVLVGPDMGPLVERTDVGIAREDQRREGNPGFDVLGPDIHHLGNHARRVGIGAELVDAAMHS